MALLKYMQNLKTIEHTFFLSCVIFVSTTVT